MEYLIRFVSRGGKGYENGYQGPKNEPCDFHLRFFISLRCRTRFTVCYYNSLKLKIQPKHMAFSYLYFMTI
jgi:hypothetical protein